MLSFLCVMGWKIMRKRAPVEKDTTFEFRVTSKTYTIDPAIVSDVGKNIGQNILAKYGDNPQVDNGKFIHFMRQRLGKSKDSMSFSMNEFDLESAILNSFPNVDNLKSQTNAENAAVIKEYGALLGLYQISNNAVMGIYFNSPSDEKAGTLSAMVNSFKHMNAVSSRLDDVSVNPSAYSGIRKYSCYLQKY